MMSLGGFEYHKPTDILRSKVPGFAPGFADDVTFIPSPEDVVLTELYKGYISNSLQPIGGPPPFVIER